MEDFLRFSICPRTADVLLSTCCIVWLTLPPVAPAAAAATVASAAALSPAFSVSMPVNKAVSATCFACAGSSERLRAADAAMFAFFCPAFFASAFHVSSF
jgi:hypothetical protein